MKDGERQVAPSIEGIRKDHVARYEFVTGRLKRIMATGESTGNFFIGEDLVLDCASGVGYGSWLMSSRASHVNAIDIDIEAVRYAREHYSKHNIDYFQHDLSEEFCGIHYDVAVAFECIEHIENPLEFLTWIDADVLYASVPNELVFPYKNYKFHYRHYTPEQFEALLNLAGWQVDEWHGQVDDQSEVAPNVQGRTIIATCTRQSGEAGSFLITDTYKDLPEVSTKDVHKKKSVAIVAMGGSCSNYLMLATKEGTRKKVADEIWAINSMGGVIQHDRLFAMDDLMVQEMRAQADPDGNVAGLLSVLKEHAGFYTSKNYDGYNSVEYPLEAVCNTVGHNYFNSTVAYAVGLAITEGFTQIQFYGVDFSYPDRHEVEKGRGCIEFLIGVAITRDIEIAISGDSYLLDTASPAEERLYGYDAEHIDFEHIDGRTVVTKRQRDKLPTVEEIEKRYDKSGVKK
jgi:hypothetical protein